MHAIRKNVENKISNLVKFFLNHWFRIKCKIFLAKIEVRYFYLNSKE